MNKRKIKHKIKDLFHKISPISIYNSKKYKIEACKNFNYKNSDISILSPNCIAGEIYNILDLKFLSPTINTSMNRKHFLLMCENLDEYLKAEIKFKKFRGENTPVLSIKPEKLSEIEIAFPHDYDVKKCIENWNKRKKRIKKDKIYIICDDQNLAEEDIERFNKLEYKHKILFTSEKKYINKNIYYIGSKKTVCKYQYKGLDGLYKFQHFFNFVEYLNK